MRGRSRRARTVSQGMCSAATGPSPASSPALRDGALPVDAFPGRWSPKRALPPEVEPAAAAAAIALEAAGWWRPGSGEGCAGGLVLASEGASALPAERFARALRGGPAQAVGPSDFLFSLPSTAAGVLGILFGLTDYQGTVAGEAGAGAEALKHAAEMMELGRLERALVVVLSARGVDLEAAAWCLEGPVEAVDPDEANERNPRCR
ncbi:MAG: hypothetical protein HY721_17730 [Planctomycetes bacterium]|nr:hypothetical protein [Planctomycetota bacterium]